MEIAEAQVVAQLESAGRFASWSCDGRRLITFGPTCDVAVWEVPTGRLVRRLNVESQLVLAAGLKSDGTLAAVGDGDVIRLWALETVVELTSLTGHRGMVSVLRYADGNRTVFSGDTRGGLRRWSLARQREVWAVP